MLAILLTLAMLQSERALLEAEDTRAEDASVLVAALQSPDPRLQRIAVRALGRLERPDYATAIRRLLDSGDSAIRAEAACALGQIGAPADLGASLEKERDGSVRGVLYETLGRLPAADEALLRNGLRDSSLEARIGAAKGLEVLFRRTKTKPQPETVDALRSAVRANDSAVLRELALLSLNAASDRDQETLGAALKDREPQVRRLAVIGLKTWVDDPSYIVRYEALRVSGSCESALAALKDASEHVRLLAIDKLAEVCAAAPLEKLVDEGDDWLEQSRALVSLARVRPESARSRLERFLTHPVWQARRSAAAAAKILKEEGSVARLRKDSQPNVVAEALETPEDAVPALESSHYGLLIEAARKLKGWSRGPTAVPRLLSTLERVTREHRATSRDPRREILERLSELGDRTAAEALRPLLSDFDPFIAALAARIIAEKTGDAVSAATRRLETAPVPPESFIEGLRSARARIQMKGRGVFVLELLSEEAPLTVARFAELAERNYYDGLTFHRIVPNFVIQGGSPGADEYVGTDGYIRDEVGRLSHLRGTVGISTRGRDTGDGQIFINLVDNFRLDHNYTVFARVVEGLDVVDRILDGDVMESIEIDRDVAR